MTLRYAAIAALVLGLAAGTAGGAEARDGCGPGFHRGFYGYCRPNLGYRPYAFRPYGYRVGFYGPRWHRWGWRRPYAWGGGYRHVGWHVGWHRRW